MLLLLFFVSILQFFTYWIFRPFIEFLTNILEIQIFPIGLLLIAIFIFSSDNNE